MSTEIRNAILGDLDHDLETARRTNPWPDYIARIEKCIDWVRDLPDDDPRLAPTPNGRFHGQYMMENCPGLYDTKPQGSPRTCHECGSHRGVHVATAMSGIAVYVCMDFDNSDLSIA